MTAEHVFTPQFSRLQLKTRHTLKEFQFLIYFDVELLIYPRLQQQQYCSDMTD